MLKYVKSLFGVPSPSGPTALLAEFKPGQANPIDDAFTTEDNAWALAIDAQRSVPMFAYSLPEGTESCNLHYRMQIKSDLSGGFVFLEMWCNLPGVGKFFSKGLHDKISGTTDWTEHEVLFHLKKGQLPDTLDLNLYAEGNGTVWIKDVAVLKTPLA